MVEIKNVSTGTSSDLKEAMKQGGLAGVGYISRQDGRCTRRPR